MYVISLIMSRKRNSVASEVVMGMWKGNAATRSKRQWKSHMMLLRLQMLQDSLKSDMELKKLTKHMVHSSKNDWTSTNRSLWISACKWESSRRRHPFSMFSIKWFHRDSIHYGQCLLNCRKCCEYKRTWLVLRQWKSVANWLDDKYKGEKASSFLWLDTIYSIFILSESKLHQCIKEVAFILVSMRCMSQIPSQLNTIAFMLVDS